MSMLLLFLKHLVGAIIPPPPIQALEHMHVMARPETLTVATRTETLTVGARTETLTVIARA